MQQAKFMEPGSKEQINAISEARRLQTTATMNMANSKKEYQKSIDDGLESLYGANSQGEYDQRLKDALGRTGIPLPSNFPETWTPDVRQKLLSLMTPEARNRVEKEDRAKENQKIANERAERLNRSVQAISRDGGTAKTEKFNAQVSTLKQDIGTGYKRLDDLISMAEPGKIPGASPAFGRFMKGDGVLAAAEAAAAKGIMPPGLKKADAILLGLAFDIASARGGGRGQLSDTKIREVQQMMPLSTDDQKTRAYKISLIENALDEANISLPENAQKDKSSIMKKTGGFDESKFIKPSAAEKEKLKLSPDDLALINKYSTGK
jgi:hypothetical protein